MTSLHDHTDGFFRRQILLTSKDRPSDRTDDPFLAEKLVAEKEGIFLWMLEGLNRLIANNYQFTISERATDNLNTIANNSRNYLDFMASEGYIEFQEGDKASTKALYETYRVWCVDNAEKTFSTGEFSTFLRENQERYHMKYLNNNLYIKKRRCRGYEGVRVLLDQSEFLPGKCPRLFSCGVHFCCTLYGVRPPYSGFEFCVIFQAVESVNQKWRFWSHS